MPVFAGFDAIIRVNGRGRQPRPGEARGGWAGRRQPVMDGEEPRGRGYSAAIAVGST